MAEKTPRHNAEHTCPGCGADGSDIAVPGRAAGAEPGVAVTEAGHIWGSTRGSMTNRGADALSRAVCAKDVQPELQHYRQSKTWRLPAEAGLCQLLLSYTGE